MTDIETKMVQAWQQAAKDLGIQFTSPFVLSRGGQSFECLGLVHRFGASGGTIISVMGQPSSKIHVPTQDDYELSELSAAYAEYLRDDFIQMLNDWHFYGPDSERPSWYIADFRDNEHPS